MKALMKELLSLTEVRQLTEDVENGVSPVLITGVSPVHRAQVEAALHLKTRRPLVVLCPDEREARRQAGDLRVLTGEEPLVLPARELQWRPMEASRQWENQRLAALYRLGSSPVVVTTPEALVQRCIPPRVLERTVLTLAVGQRWDLGDLARRLAGAGYTRCDQVEGPGQFALRGGILDVFSPGMEQPVRCEFFDDEIDSLGIFDTATQRRVENRREALLLPAAEVLPAWQEGQAEQAARRLEAAVKRLARKQDTQALRELLTADAARLRQGMAPNGPDRCLAAVYPEKTTALDYLPENALVCVEESGRTAEALRGWLWQLKEDVSAGMEAGFLAGELADFAASEQELAARLEKRPTVQLDSLTTGLAAAGPPGPAAADGQAAVQLRRVPGAGLHGPDPLSHRRLSGDGAVRRRGPGQEPSPDAGGPEDLRRRGPDRGEAPGEGHGAHRRGRSLRRVRISGGAAGGADGGAADHAPVRSE